MLGVLASCLWADLAMLESEPASETQLSLVQCHAGIAKGGAVGHLGRQDRAAAKQCKPVSPDGAPVAQEDVLAKQEMVVHTHHCHHHHNYCDLPFNLLWWGQLLQVKACMCHSYMSARVTS